MPVVRGRARRNGNGGVKAILMTSIRDGSSEYHVAVVTNGENALVRLRIRDNNEEVVTLYLDPRVATLLGKWLLHLATMAEHPMVVQQLWREAGHKYVPGKRAEQGETGVQEQLETGQAEEEEVVVDDVEFV